MNDILKILAVFILIIVLLRRRLDLGKVMLIASAALGALYGIGPIEQARAAFFASVDLVTVNLVTGLVLIMVLENIIRKRGLLRQMTQSLSSLARDPRITMAVLPGIIGLLPSAGGAAFSAPLVQEAAGDVSIPPERRALINYWFRHIWEYISPLYPGIVLAAAVTRIPMNDLLLSQLPLPLAVVVVGALLCFRGIKTPRPEDSRSLKDFKTLFVSLLPITASLIMVVGFHMPLSIAMAAMVLALFVIYRYPLAEIRQTLKESISLNIVIMVIGIMVFKGMLDATGAIEALPAFFAKSGLPAAVVFFALPFIVGLLTGLTVGFVGATFPIITAMSAGSPEPGVVTFAFASGFAGVMLSPTHLCLLLTLRYFNADIARTYRLLYLPVAIVFTVGLLRLWIG